MFLDKWAEKQKNKRFTSLDVPQLKNCFFLYDPHHGVSYIQESEKSGFKNTFLF